MLSTEITTAVAAQEGVDPLQLEEPLYEAIDVGALEAMLETAGQRDGGDFEVVFTYYGYEVTVDETGDVTVSQPEPVEESANQPATGH